MPTISIWLADDDTDDGFLFREALDELSFQTQLLTISQGEQLTEKLNDVHMKLPDVIFLDLNMPRKNGFDCLLEIKANEKLRSLPVIIFSTSGEIYLINQLYKTGALRYIRKPNNFEDLKELVNQALLIISQGKITRPPRESFVLSPQKGFT